MRSEYQLKNVRNVSPHLKRAILNEARAREITMNDVVGEVLAKHFDATFEMSGEKTLGGEITGDQLLLKLPVEINACIYGASRANRMTESSVVQAILSDHFGLLYTPTRRKGGGRRKKEVSSGS